MNFAFYQCSINYITSTAKNMVSSTSYVSSILSEFIFVKAHKKYCTTIEIDIVYNNVQFIKSTDRLYYYLCHRIFRLLLATLLKNAMDYSLV